MQLFDITIDKKCTINPDDECVCVRNTAQIIT